MSNIYKKLYYEKNKETLLTRQKKYHGENKEDLQAKQKTYYEKNKQKILARQKIYWREYYLKNRNKLIEKASLIRIELSKQRIEKRPKYKANNSLTIVF